MNGHAAVVDQGDRPVYVMVKAGTYESILQKHEAAGTQRLNGHAPAPLNARKIHRSVFGKYEPRSHCLPSTLQGITTHYLQNRLENLAKRGTLSRAGRGLRKSVLYEWNEPVRHSTLTSFMNLKELTQASYGLTYDLSLALTEFSTEPFLPMDFVSLVYTKTLTLQNGHRARSARSKDPPAENTEFLRARLRTAAKLGLVEKFGRGYRISRRGCEAVQWLELFIHDVEYAESQ